MPSPPKTVMFGPNVSNGAPFSVDITAVFTDSVTPLSFQFVTPPSTVSNLSVTPLSATGTTTFTATGRVSFAANQTLVLVPISVSDGNFVANGSFTLVVVPEPATASVLVGGVALATRRRR